MLRTVTLCKTMDDKYLFIGKLNVSDMYGSDVRYRGETFYFDRSTVAVFETTEFTTLDFHRKYLGTFYKDSGELVPESELDRIDSLMDDNDEFDSLEDEFEYRKFYKNIEERYEVDHPEIPCKIQIFPIVYSKIPFIHTALMYGNFDIKNDCIYVYERRWEDIIHYVVKEDLEMTSSGARFAKYRGQYMFTSADEFRLRDHIYGPFTLEEAERHFADDATLIKEKMAAIDTKLSQEKVGDVAVVYKCLEGILSSIRSLDVKVKDRILFTALLSRVTKLMKYLEGIK